MQEAQAGSGMPCPTSPSDPWPGEMRNEGRRATYGALDVRALRRRSCSLPRIACSSRTRADVGGRALSSLGSFSEL